MKKGNSLCFPFDLKDFKCKCYSRNYEKLLMNRYNEWNGDNSISQQRERERIHERWTSWHKHREGSGVERRKDGSRQKREKIILCAHKLIHCRALAHLLLVGAPMALAQQQQLRQHNTTTTMNESERSTQMRWLVQLVDIVFNWHYPKVYVCCLDHSWKQWH